MNKRNMCHDIKSSLTTFFFSQLISWWGIKEGLVWFSVFVATFSTIQLVDALLWMTQKRPRLNFYIGFIFIPIILWLEIMTVYYLSPWRNKWWEVFIHVFTTVMVFTFWVGCNKPSFPKKGGRYLVWCSTPVNTPTQVLIFISFLIPFLIAYPNIFVRTLIVLIGLATFLDAFNRQEFGSRWCHTGNALSFVLLGEILYKKFNKTG